MKKLASLAALLALSATPAAAAYVYSPGVGNAAAEGDIDNVVISRFSPIHTQWFFQPATFGELPLSISGVSFRFDRFHPNYGSGVWEMSDAFVIRLNTLATAPSRTFANNVISAQTVRVGGDIPYSFAGPTVGAKAWGIHIAFDRPYIYRPDAGALVFDLTSPTVTQGRVLSGVPDLLTASWDFVDNNPLASRLYNFNPTAATGQLLGYSPVARFEVTALPPAAAPEPAAWALMIGGFGLAGAILRRQRKSPAVLAAGLPEVLAKAAG
jgi:hypothetical protein